MKAFEVMETVINSKQLLLEYLIGELNEGFLPLN